MTLETVIGLVLTVIVSIIGHFLKTLVDELKNTNKEHSKHILDILERLVRLEERTLMKEHREAQRPR